MLLELKTHPGTVFLRVFLSEVLCTYLDQSQRSYRCFYAALMFDLYHNFLYLLSYCLFIFRFSDMTCKGRLCQFCKSKCAFNSGENHEPTIQTWWNSLAIFPSNYGHQIFFVLHSSFNTCLSIVLLRLHHVNY